MNNSPEHSIIRGSSVSPCLLVAVSAAFLSLMGCQGTDVVARTVITPPAPAIHEPRLEVMAPKVLSSSRESADPSLAIDPLTGDLLLAWAALSDDGHWDLLFARSQDGGSTFGDAVRINDVAGDLSPHAEGAPRLVAAPGVLATFWNNRRKVEGRRFNASDLRFARSTDGGTTWSAAIDLQDPLDASGLPPRANTFHGAAWGQRSMLVVAWLDGRDRDRRRLERGVASGLSPEEAARKLEAFADENDPSDGDATVYAAVSHDLGASWEPTNRRIAGGICPCCRVTLRRTPDGEVLGAWREHFSGSVRDPVIRTVITDSDTGTAESIRAHEDGWVFPGCPHSGPGLDVDAAGNIHIAWYTGAKDRMGIHYARMDAGATRFGSPVALLTGNAVGIAHPAVVAVPGGGVVVASNVDSEGRRRIVLLTVRADGSTEPAVAVPDSDRGTHPQLAGLTDGGVVVAWTESRDGAQRVRLARLAANHGP